MSGDVSHSVDVRVCTRLRELYEEQEAAANAAMCTKKAIGLGECERFKRSTSDFLTGAQV